MKHPKASPNISRRKFMSVSTAAAAATTVAVTATAAEHPDATHSDATHPDAEWRNRQSDMAYRRLGRTNFMISELICGGNRIAPDNFQHVEMAVERGLNYFDTAPDYGRGKSEMGYARVIDTPARRHRVFLNTKVSDFDNHRRNRALAMHKEMTATQREELDRDVAKRLENSRVKNADYSIFYSPPPGQHPQIDGAYLADAIETRYPDWIDRRKEYYDKIINSVEASLKRLGTDYLDLLMCPHGASSDRELEIPEIFEAFYRLKREGKVRFLGVSAHSDPAGMMHKAAKSGMYDVMMPAYSIVNAGYFKDALAAAKKADMGIIAMKAARAVYPDRGARYQTPYVDDVARLHREIPGDMKLPMKAYLWVLQNTQIAAVNSEMGTAEHVADNLPLAGRKVDLPHGD